MQCAVICRSQAQLLRDTVPAWRAGRRMSCIDVAASLEMGMPLLKELSGCPHGNGLTSLPWSLACQPPDIQQPLPFSAGSWVRSPSCRSWGNKPNESWKQWRKIERHQLTQGHQGPCRSRGWCLRQVFTFFVCLALWEHLAITFLSWWFHFVADRHCFCSPFYQKQHRVAGQAMPMKGKSESALGAPVLCPLCPCSVSIHLPPCRNRALGRTRDQKRTLNWHLGNPLAVVGRCGFKGSCRNRVRASTSRRNWSRS